MFWFATVQMKASVSFVHFFRDKNTVTYILLKWFTCATSLIIDDKVIYLFFFSQRTAKAGKMISMGNLKFPKRNGKHEQHLQISKFMN